MPTKKKKKGTANPIIASLIHDNVSGPIGRSTGVIPSHWSSESCGYATVIDKIYLKKNTKCKLWWFQKKLENVFQYSVVKYLRHSLWGYANVQIKDIKVSLCVT